MPAVLVDLNGVPGLSYVAQPKDGAGGLNIGGMTRQRNIERSPLVAERVPLIAETMPHVAHAAIRNRGTIGGSLAHADPAAELPAVVLALGATLTLTSKSGTRTVPAAEFFLGLFTTAVQPGEILTQIHIPPRPERSWLCVRGDLQAAWRLRAGRSRGCRAGWTSEAIARRARIALLSVGDRPMIAEHAAKTLVGQRPEPELVRAAADAAAASDIDPSSDIHASARFRRQLAKVLTRRALTTAFERAARESG